MEEVEETPGSSWRWYRCQEGRKGKVAAADPDQQIKRTAQRTERVMPAGAAAKLGHHTLGALGGPLYLLIWICGGYFALAPLLASVPAPRGTGRLLDFLHTLLNLGIFAVAFWFCY